MSLEVFTLEQAEEWDRVVKSFTQNDVYYISGYVRGFFLHGDGEPLLFYYNDGKTKGINVVMKRDISRDRRFVGKLEENRFFDFSTPYGYGGWLIEGTDTNGLFEEYEKWCFNNNIISEFVRFHPMLANHTVAEKHYETVQLGKTVAMDISSPEIIWSNITSKNRNVIRKAQKNGIRIYNGRYPEIYRNFRDIYNQTMDKDSADEYYYFGEEFYDSILNNLSHNAQVFYAVFEGKIIAASIMLNENGRMNYHLSGSVREYSHLAPTNLLLYEAALWGCANGCKTLYLGGGVGSCEDSLFKFKKAFYRGDDLNSFWIGKKVFNTDEYERLIKMRSSIENEGFFPKYRG